MSHCGEKTTQQLLVFMAAIKELLASAKTFGEDRNVLRGNNNLVKQYFTGGTDLHWRAFAVIN